MAMTMLMTTVVTLRRHLGLERDTVHPFGEPGIARMTGNDWNVAQSARICTKAEWSQSAHYFARGIKGLGLKFDRKFTMYI
jgi:hypothetical protein